MQHNKKFVTLLMTLAFLAPATAQNITADGVALIDQQHATVGGIGPGDSSGFPITITQPGPYRLAGNLNVPSGKNGIEIAVANVQIDLNGFSITYAQSPKKTAGRQPLVQDESG